MHIWHVELPSPLHPWIGQVGFKLLNFILSLSNAWSFSWPAKVSAQQIQPAAPNFFSIGWFTPTPSSFASFLLLPFFGELFEAWEEPLIYYVNGFWFWSFFFHGRGQGAVLPFWTRAIALWLKLAPIMRPSYKGPRFLQYPSLHILLKVLLWVVIVQLINP
jgi:hypothetical protein